MAPPYSGLWPSLRRLLRDAVAVADTPWPVARMLQTGGSLAAAFGSFAVLGALDLAVLCAIFTNLLLFTDQAGPFRERVAVVVSAAAAMGLAGALGVAFAGSEPFILLAILTIAIGAGLVHSSLPGVEMIPRQSLICFVISAYLPQVTGTAFVCGLVGTGYALAGIALHSALRQGIAGPHLAEARARVIWPGLRFGLSYGMMAALGLLSGSMVDASRPYWVTITLLVVMQPGRRASAVRALQRFLGTLDGVVVAFLLAVILAGPTWRPVLIVGVLLIPFLWPLGFARNYGLGVAVISTWILLLLDLVLPGADDAHQLFAVRLWDTAAGCALAVLGTVLANLPRPEVSPSGPGDGGARAAAARDAAVPPRDRPGDGQGG